MDRLRPEISGLPGTLDPNNKSKVLLSSADRASPIGLCSEEAAAIVIAIVVALVVVRAPGAIAPTGVTTTLAVRMIVACMHEVNE